MYVATIVVVDATRARLFTFERESSPTGLRESFTEVHDLVHLGRRLRAGDSGDTEFARGVVVEIERVLKMTDSTRVILCASPNMLGELRKVLGSLYERATITTLARDLVWCSATELRERLATYKTLPAPPERVVELR